MLKIPQSGITVLTTISRAAPCLALAPHQSVCRTCPVPLVCLPVSPSYFFLPLLPSYTFPRSLSLPFSPSLVLKHRVNWHARRDAGRSPPHPGHGHRHPFLLLRVTSVRALWSVRAPEALREEPLELFLELQPVPRVQLTQLRVASAVTS